MNSEAEAEERPLAEASEPVQRPGRRPAPPVDATPYTLDLTAYPGHVSWTAIFGNDGPVELEVGSGKGLFLTNAGTANPGRNFLGIELAKKYAGQAAERVAKRKLPNVRVLAGDARLFLARHVPPESLLAVHVYFPDPWWKARHKKRRVFSEPLVADVRSGLVPGGDLWVATDVEEYYGVICRMMEANPAFVDVPVDDPRAPEHDLDYLTHFERKYRIEGRPIYRKHYRRI